VWNPQQPPDKPFHSETEASVRNTTELAQISQPLIARITGFAFFRHSFIQHRKRVYLFGNPEQLTVALTGDKIGGLRPVGVSGIYKVREGLDGSRNAHHPEWGVA